MSAVVVAWSSRRAPAWLGPWMQAVQRVAPAVLWINVDKNPEAGASARQREWWQAAQQALAPGRPTASAALMVWHQQQTLHGTHAWRWLRDWQAQLLQQRQLPAALAWRWADLPLDWQRDVPMGASAPSPGLGLAPSPAPAPAPAPAQAGLTPLPARAPGPGTGSGGAAVEAARSVASAWGRSDLAVGPLAATRVAGRYHPRNLFHQTVAEGAPMGEADLIVGGNVTRDPGGLGDGGEADLAAADMGAAEDPSAAAVAGADEGQALPDPANPGLGGGADLVSSLASALLSAVRSGPALASGSGSASGSGTGSGSGSGSGSGAAVVASAPRFPQVATFSIHVDSRDRDVALYPTPSYYKVRLKESIRKVRAVNLTSIVVPNTEQVIRANPVRIRNNRFYWTSRERHAVLELPMNPFLMTRDSPTVVVTDPNHGLPTLLPSNLPPAVCLCLPVAAGGLSPAVWFGPLPITVLDGNRYTVVLPLPSQFTGVTGGAGVRRFQVMDNSFSVELDPGFYDPSSFKDQFLSKVNQVQREDPLALVSDYHNFDMEMDTNTNTVKIRSLAVSNLATPFVATYNSSVVGVNYADHNLVPGDKIRITKTNPFGNIPTARFNETFTVLSSNFSTHFFEIDVGIKANETNPAAGGTGVQISRLMWFSMHLDTNVVSDSFGPLIGYGSTYPRTFLQEHVNLGPDGIPLSPIQLSGENYILMQIPTFDKGLRQQSTSEANRAFAVLQLSLPPGSIIYNQFISPTVVFAPEALDQLTELEVRMIKGNGDLFFFNNIDHSFTLEIMYEQFSN